MNLNSDIWRNLVFEGKNKEYGAYYLRKTSSKRHIYALIMTISIVGVLVLSFYIWKIFKTYDAYDLPMYELTPVNLSELNMAEFVTPENIEKLQPEETAKNTPPEIVTDETEIPEFVEQIEFQNIPADSTELTPADSILLADIPLNQPENTEDELVTYVLDPTNSGQKAPSLQTTILRHVYHNLKYPDAAYKQRIKGKIVYSFIVNEDGTISDIVLEKGVYIFLDEEVLRVIRLLPVLEPEKKDGNPIRVKFYLPVVFS